MVFGLISRAGEHLGDQLELQRNAGQALRKTVVNLASNAIALSKNRIEPGFNSPDPQQVELPTDHTQRGEAERVEPIGLIEMRLQIKREGRPGFIPHAIVIAGNNPEGVSPRRYIGVISHAVGPGSDPVAVKAFEPVFELD